MISNQRGPMICIIGEIIGPIIGPIIGQIHRVIHRSKIIGKNNTNLEEKAYICYL